MSEPNKLFNKNICVDPSFFTTSNRLQKLLPVLNKLKSSKSKIILPSALRPLFERQIKPTKEMDEPFEPTREETEKLLQAWHSGRRRREATDNRKYNELLSHFYEEFKPIFADEIVGDVEKIGEESIYRADALRRLGKLVGNTVFELMAVCALHIGIITCYGRRTLSFIRKLECAVLEGHSRIKHAMIEHEGISEFLLIVGFFFFRRNSK